MIITGPVVYHYLKESLERFPKQLGQGRGAEGRRQDFPQRIGNLEHERLLQLPCPRYPYSGNASDAARDQGK
jgi:hypothetical protein